MTTEDDFQAALDADPTDWQTRLVFADWLDDRGDPRGPGYRVLGRLRLRPFSMGKRNWWTAVGEGPPTYNHLPPDWFEKVAGYEHPAGGWRWPDHFDESRDNRREIEDASARAFAELPPARRAELLIAERPAGKARARKKARKRRPAVKKRSPARKRRKPKK